MRLRSALFATLPSLALFSALCATVPLQDEEGTSNDVSKVGQRTSRKQQTPGAFREYPVAVELRHKSWSDAIADTVAMLNSFDAAWVQIDEPKFRFSIRQNYLPNITSFYYMRLHGRNTANWWRHAAAEDRYDYLYSAEELREFSDVAGAAKALVRKSYLYTNNHFASKSVVNAVMLKAQLGQPIEGEYPPELIERYPELRDLVITRQPATSRLLS